MNLSRLLAALGRLSEERNAALIELLGTVRYGVQSLGLTTSEADNLVLVVAERVAAVQPTFIPDPS